MKRSPLLRKTPMARRPKAPKRASWIKTRHRQDLSRMDCCPEAKARASALVALGCACCGARDPEVHHIRRGTGMSLRAPWWRTLPLCQEHHTTGGPGISVHSGERVWQWDEIELLERVNSRLPAELCEPKGNECTP